MRIVVKPVRMRQCLDFNYLEFRLLDSEGRMATFPVRALSREVRYRLGNAQRWFIEIEGRVVGIFVTDITAEALHLSRVAIVPIYRGRGIGTRVLAHLERCARRIGIQRISLSVRKRNTRALKLYRTLGYTKCLEGA